ncbi:MAG: hypothetical protein QW478_08240 [Candidatus Micrarchaeaceae archaeon]
MKSIEIYHIPVRNHLRRDGFSVRILKGLDIKGMKKSRVRKTTDLTIEEELMAMYLMIREGNICDILEFQKSQ